MDSLNFYTAVSYGKLDKSCLETFSETIDNYFYLGGKKAQVLRHVNLRENTTTVSLIDPLPDEKLSYLFNFLKVTSYFTLILPLLGLAAKFILRKSHHFYLISAEEEAKAATVIQTAFKGFSARKKLKELKLQKAETQKRTAAVAIIQTAFRGFSARKKLKELKLQKAETQKRVAATAIIQTAFRGFSARKKFKAIKLATDKAKLIVQINANQKNLQNFYTQLQDNEHKIQNGYGEFIVFLPNHKAVSEEIYEAAYQIITKYSRQSNLGIKNLAAFIREEIQKIDPALEIAFVPRSLYELIFIRAAIQEDLNEKMLCPFETAHNPNFFEDNIAVRKETIYELKNEKNDLLKELSLVEREDAKMLISKRLQELQLEIQQSSDKLDQYQNKIKAKSEKCWHQCIFTDRDPAHELQPKVKKLAFRLNALALEILKPQGHFTGKQILQATENELNFLKSHRQTFPNMLSNGSFTSYCGAKGVTVNFGYHKSFGRIDCYPMGIRDNKDAQVIKMAIALECTEIAQNAFILYRGGDIVKDSLISDNDLKNKSLSYGTSLFAGAIHDPTATVFHYTIGEQRDTYAMIIPYEECNKSPFFIPTVNTICQLSSKGEFFHGRSKIPKDTQGRIQGIFCGSGKRDFLNCTLSTQALGVELRKYHSKSYLLTSI